MAIDSFTQVTKTAKNSGRAYDGIYYDGKQIIISKGSILEFETASIFVDKKNKAIKLLHGGEFKRNKSKRISVSNLGVPKGRYERDADYVVDGAIYRLVTKEQSNAS